MSVWVVIAVALGAALVGIAAGFWLPPHGRRPRRERARPVRRILLPFAGEAISRRAFEAATRLAKAENATIIPAFLARVIAVMGLVSIGFLLFLLFTSNPFDRLVPPAAEGSDLNPLLQRQFVRRCAICPSRS